MSSSSVQDSSLEHRSRVKAPPPPRPHLSVIAETICPSGKDLGLLTLLRGFRGKTNNPSRLSNHVDLSIGRIGPWNHRRDSEQHNPQRWPQSRFHTFTCVRHIPNLGSRAPLRPKLRDANRGTLCLGSRTNWQRVATLPARHRARWCEKQRASRRVVYPFDAHSLGGVVQELAKRHLPH
ncbi:MAG: hypothetical protein RL518_854 [Pseudomonadota bacterium]